MAKADSVVRILALTSGEGGSGGAGGTSNYPDLSNLPKINGITLKGNTLSANLGIKTSELDNDAAFIAMKDLVAGTGIDITGNTISTTIDPAELLAAAMKTGNIEFNNIDDTYTLPVNDTQYMVFINGMYLTEGADYTIDTTVKPNTITFDTVYEDFDTCSLVWFNAKKVIEDSCDCENPIYASKGDIDNMFQEVIN